MNQPRRSKQAARRKCSRRKWLSHCAYVAHRPRTRLFFELVMVMNYGTRMTARDAWEVATAGYLPRTRFKPLRSRKEADDLPW